MGKGTEPSEGPPNADFWMLVLAVPCSAREFFFTLLWPSRYPFNWLLAWIGGLGIRRGGFLEPNDITKGKVVVCQDPFHSPSLMLLLLQLYSCMSLSQNGGALMVGRIGEHI